MKELESKYNPQDMEERIYKEWTDNKYFHAEVDKSKKPFTIVMPPPNVTGQLHMGHALDETLQDILIRTKRMQGYSALWVPGTDHASIATEVKIIEKLAKSVDPSRVILLLNNDIAVNSQLYMSALVKNGFYNFTRNFEGIKFLYSLLTRTTFLSLICGAILNPCCKTCAKNV